MTTRETIIEEAKSWLRTPFRQHARLKGIGVDCGQLLIACYVAAEVFPDFQPEYTTVNFHLHKEADHGTYLRPVLERCDEITEAEVLPGDFVLYKRAHAFVHGAIVVEWPTKTVRAMSGAGVSYAHGLNEPFVRKAEKKFFRPKGLK